MKKILFLLFSLHSLSFTMEIDLSHEIYKQRAKTFLQEAQVESKRDLIKYLERRIAHAVLILQDKNENIEAQERRNLSHSFITFFSRENFVSKFVCSYIKMTNENWAFLNNKVFGYYIDQCELPDCEESYNTKLEKVSLEKYKETLAKNKDITATNLFKCSKNFAFAILNELKTDL